MIYHLLEPEATGTVGEGAEWTVDADGRRVQRGPLRCELVGWLGDDLVSVHPDLIVSGGLADALRASSLTGFALGEAVVTRSEQFVSYGGALPTRWERLEPTGSEDAGDDLVRQDGGLLVSEPALALLNDHRIAEARLQAGDEGAPEVLRFALRRDAARAAAARASDAELSREQAAERAEATRITRLLASTKPLGETVPPTFRTSAKQEISGDLTLAVAALGGTLDDERVLAVLRLVPGPIDYVDGSPHVLTYRSADRSLQVHLAKDGTVKGVEFVLRPHRNAPEASYPRSPSLVTGVDPLTREALRGRLGAPVRSKQGSRLSLEEYRVHRKRVLIYSDGEGELEIVVVGTKA